MALPVVAGRAGADSLGELLDRGVVTTGGAMRSWATSLGVTALLNLAVLAMPGAAEAQSTNTTCTISAIPDPPQNVVTCTGYQSNGVSSGRDFNNTGISGLYVNDLLAPITPPPNSPGVSVSGGTTATYMLQVLLDQQHLSTSGAGAHGIFFSSQGGTGSGGKSCDDPTGIFCQAGHTGGTGHVAQQPYINFQGAFTASAVAAAGGTSGPTTGVRVVGISGNGGAGGHSECCNGGRGGTGGAGPAISIVDLKNSTSSVFVTGDNSPAFFGLSQAGQGGKGGSSVEFGKGGSGGSGGVGGAVTLDLASSITTSGVTSPAIAMASLGGNGGQGGSGGWTGGTGGGGTAAAGGTVTITTAGKIETDGAESYGIIAQSIGGRGGAGGSTVSLVTFAASGGSGGPGGTVNVTNDAAITSKGEQSAAIVAQSIGGAGGHGGDGFGVFYAAGGDGSVGGAGGQITITSSAPIDTYGNDAHGIQAQSIGGTGGDGGSAGGIEALGGKATAESDGGNVSIVHSGARIRTGLGPTGQAGPDPTCGTGCSHGIFAQSIGGGGGNGGSSAGWFSVGGQGGGGGRGSSAEVTVTSSTISTSLIDSNAIFVQSIGGGGGHGGNGVSVGVGTSIAIGGGGGGGGNGEFATALIEGGTTLTTAGDRSHGMLVQSIGGGGGTGGFAVGVSVSEYASAGVAVGGTGGSGGFGGSVFAYTCYEDCNTAQNTIQTKGESATGITAQSIGGGGGNGGFAIDVSAGASIASIAFAIGGNGGIAGNGLDTNVLSDAVITTSGSQSHGIFAQSVGGGGGNGGFAIAGAVNLDGPGIAVAVGGQGKSGGNSSTVDVTSTGRITTHGSQANAILAQSIGGGGGNGGLSVAGTISGETAGLGVSVGGNGGSGGAANKVTVASSAAIVTTGDKAMGLVAQSIGGGGGTGGMSLSGAISGSNAKTLTFALGGEGGTGGNGGEVAVTSGGNITTGNANDPGNLDDPTDNAHGIMAQSVGGGGGAGGFAGALTLGLQGESTTVNVAVAVGGKGGSAGTGGKVSVSNTDAAAYIFTYSTQSHGVFAQSVGGSGGAGGSGFSGTIEALATGESSTYNLSIAVGGKGGAGSTGGQVQVTNAGSVGTHGNNAHGLFASSVGGSGGSGGSATTLALNCKQDDCRSDDKDDPPTGSNYNLQVGVGGNGGGGSHGGNVTITNYGIIQTRGDGAMALYAYSVGGSGGDGGDASSKSIPLTDRVKFYNNIQIEVGGTGGSSSHGGSVTIQHSNASITTEGGNAPAVFAQSVGGGGGRGGTGASGFTGKVAVGGGGGAAGDGGTVTVGIDGGSITTLSASDPSSTEPDLDASFGIFAQSVGGGGGYGGNPEMGDAKVVHIGTGLAFGAAGGSAGNGGTVNVTPTADITTNANNSIGIFAQSVGGGGGVAGDAGINPTFSTYLGSNGNTGNGGGVTVSYKGNLVTNGDGAHGIFAQSAGGKTSGSSSAGAVQITVLGGAVKAEGTDADGIVAQSVGLSSSGATVGVGIIVNVDNDVVVQGGRSVDSQTAGIRFLDGGANNLNNFGGTITALAGGTGVVHSGVGSLAINNQGTILTSAGVGGTAIQSAGGSDRVHNQGLIEGSVELGAGRNRFVNLRGGTFVPGERIRLGHGNRLVNQGHIIIGGAAGAPLSHHLEGDFVQTASGRTTLVLQHSLPHDRPVVTVTGKVDMAGSFAADIRSPEHFANGSGTLTIIRAEGGITEATARRLEIVESPIADLEVSFLGGEAQLRYAIDFANVDALATMNGNQAEVARALEALREADPASPLLMSVAAAEDIPSFAQAVGRLSPEPYAANQLGTLFSSLSFSGTLLDCAAAPGDALTVTETDCGWMGVQTRRFERDSTDNDSRYTDDRWGISGGIERRLGEGWSLGVGLGYERIDASTGGFSDTDGHQVQGGVTARLEQGPWLFAAGVTAGWAWLDVDRDTGADGRTQADQDLGFVTGRLRAAHRFTQQGWRIEPRVDLAATVIRMDNFTEDGAAAAALDVDSQTEIFLSLHPAIEIGHVFALVQDWRIEPRASIGVTRFLTGNEPNVDGSFAAAPGAGAIGSKSSLDRTLLDLELGVDLARGDRLSLRASGFAQLGDDTESLGATLSVGYRF